MATGTMATKNVKRSLRTISAHGKLEAIRRVHDGESKASVARDIGVPESTLRGWCKNESKISYLSRQSSPETDESVEPKEKRTKIEDPMQPFNLSLKSTPTIYTPSSEALYTPMDYSKNDMDCTPKTPQNLSIKNETPKSTASQERTRAELARLSVELGLNRPEMFNANCSTSGLAELAANFTILSQWNLLMQQQIQPKTSTSPGSSSLKQQSLKPLKEQQQSSEEYISGWLKAQESLLVQRVTAAAPAPAMNGIPTTTATTANNNNNSSTPQTSPWNNLYKQAGFPIVNEKPILYQQLTKDAAVAENLSLERSSNKVKSVLDHLLHNNNNNNNAVDKKSDCMSIGEAVEHGEKFLRWVESYSNPSVTAVQITQFKALLANVRNGADRKNGDLQNKTKVKRK